MGPDDGAFDETLGAEGSAPTTATTTEVYERRYRLGQEIARGGMGRIIVARDELLGRPVAIKEVLRANAEILARFQREALITARLQHPAIVPLYEAGRNPSGEPYYVMRLVRGKSLEKAIDEKKTFRARLDLLAHLAAATDALAYAHSQSIIHRDLKPANVLVGEFGETVVIDWGLAKDLSSQGAPDLDVGPYRGAARGADQTMAGSIMGTPAYMPPEQARGEPVDARSDVYSLGAMLHHVLAGEEPFGGRTVDELLRKVLSQPPRPLPEETPPDLRSIVVKAMSPAPGDRYPTAREMADDLRSCLAGRLVGAHQYSGSQLAGRWLRRPWLPVALGLALLAVTFVGAMWITRERGRRLELEDDVARLQDEAARLERESSRLREENARLWQSRSGAHPAAP